VMIVVKGYVLVIQEIEECVKVCYLFFDRLRLR
jgi:hypothetical protein